MTSTTSDLLIPEFERARVLIVGDVMLDRYLYGPTGRISPEAPVPVVQISDEEERPGGAANVALNVAALGAPASLVGLVGADATAESLRRRLAAAGIRCHLEPVEGHPTICKLRVLSRHQQLIRLDFERPFTASERGGLARAFDAALPEADVVVLSDYAKGTLGDAPTLIERARAAGKPVIVDPKGRDFSRYRGATLVTPNAAEFENVVGPWSGSDELVAHARQMSEALELGAMLITRGEHGMTLVRPDAPPLHLPAHARDVYDVTGAGDTVVAVLAAVLAGGGDLPTATALANLAAGLVVAKVGTASVSFAELREASGGSGWRRGITTPEVLTNRLTAARSRGERIVFTNGCFDILHAGHVAYLEKARALGDRLVVAVNDDASVTRLKGEGRPVTALENRMAVLAGLAAVDWVLPFSEDTPAALIERIRPDILVKGGDYHPEAVVGGDFVRANGGQIVILIYVEGSSTTRLIETVRGHTND